MDNKKITAEIIAVGTEILLGNIVNTNAAYIAAKLPELGIACFYQSVVGDNAERLEGAIRQALSRSDVVILSGGLGPTEDDLTKETACKVAGSEMYCHEESKERLIAYFEKRGLTLTENNMKQVMMPKGGVVLTNNNGTAPGVIIPYENKHIVLLPGPPGELKPMFEESVVPYLKKLTPGVILSQTVKVCSVGESMAETMIADLIDAQDNPSIATYAKTGEVHIRVTAYAEDEARAEKLIKPVVWELKNRFGSNVYTTKEDVSLEAAVVELLKSGDLKLMTVESCTGGMVASRIVNVPGASEVFKCGLVTYSNKAKRKLAGVKKSTIVKYSAVSRETAYEMVKAPEVWPKADIVIGVTGYASPCEDETKTGLVYISCNACGKITVKEFRFSGNRQKVRESATAQALILARQCILEALSEKAFG